MPKFGGERERVRGREDDLQGALECQAALATYW